jgi:NADPH-dependent 2,4-dienoyl-CoA reductase/sulfur reductase-like enzyme
MPKDVIERERCRWVREKRPSDSPGPRGSLTLVGSGEPAAPPSIVVVGGGFSGVAVAAQLLRRVRRAVEQFVQESSGGTP